LTSALTDVIFYLQLGGTRKANPEMEVSGHAKPRGDTRHKILGMLWVRARELAGLPNADGIPALFFMGLKISFKKSKKSKNPR